LPGKVKVNLAEAAINVEGPKGSLSEDLHPLIEVEVGENEITLKPRTETRETRALHGLYRSLINNMVKGVTEGFKRVLTINGVGYRAEIQGENLVLNLGFSNPIEYPVPPGISIEVEANNRIVVNGIDKKQLGQVCAEIRAFRPPEPYKGKGVKYETELVRRKIGKSGIK
jgi:large subunit ribosomal protein L6